MIHLKSNKTSRKFASLAVRMLLVAGFIATVQPAGAAPSRQTTEATLQAAGIFRGESPDVHFAISPAL